MYGFVNVCKLLHKTHRTENLFSLSMILCLDAKVSMHDQTWPTNQSYPNCKFEKKTIAVHHLYARVHTFLYL